jgi:hypothetical protein
MPVLPGSSGLPEKITTVAQFLVALREMRVRSDLTYRQLTAKATSSGDVLPASTIASALSRTTLPRREVVAAFVRACGLDEQFVEQWLAVRDRLAAPADPAASGELPGSASPGSASTEPAAPGSASTEPASTGPAAVAGRRWRAVPLVASAVLACALLAVLAVVMQDRRTGDNPGPRSASTGTGGPVPLPDGWYLLHPAHVASPRLCVGEGRERNGRTDRPLAVQRECPDIVPDTYLKASRPNVYAIEWHSPVEGVGCLTVDEGETVGGALLAPTDCVGAPDQLFLFEPVDSPVAGGFRLRPVHSGLCIGLLYGPEDVHAGAELAQADCTGTADQEFLLDRATPKSVSP